MEDPPDVALPFADMTDESPQDEFALDISEVQEALDESNAAVLAAETQIKKKENEIQTAQAIADRDISNLERQAEDAEGFDEYTEAHNFQRAAAERRVKLANEVNGLESELGGLRGEQIEAAAIQAAREARLESLKEQSQEQASRQSVSEEQVRRAAELEERLERLEQERGDLVARIEQYAPLVEAQREATSGSGSAELSRAYAEQADNYRDEWQRWLKWLGVAVGVALVAGVGVILLTHPADNASPGTIASRIAIEVLVLGLLVYGVRVTAHQFRVHRHLETVCRSKASALRTFNRLVAGPGEAEVRTAVAVALAQAVFDSNSTGFIDSSQDGVTIVERVVGPIAQRLSS